MYNKENKFDHSVISDLLNMLNYSSEITLWSVF